VPGQITLADGARLRVRPIDPADRDPLAEAFARLSDQSRRRRFLAPKPRLTTRELEYLTDVDHVTHEALVAIDETTGHIVGVGRYATGHVGGPVADMALAVADAWQRRGIGHALAVRLVERARANGITALTGSTLSDNLGARTLLDRLGFRMCSASGGVLELELDVARATPPRGHATAERAGSRAARRASAGRAWRRRASDDPRPCAWSRTAPERSRDS
jgi:GNAT superfamily N-acetyltransferase